MQIFKELKSILTTRRGHHMMNTEEGKKVEAKLWSETMEELERVAGVRAFLGVQQQ